MTIHMIVTLLSLLGMLVTGAGWAYTRAGMYFAHRQRLARMFEVLKELSPNGGASIKDRVEGLERTQREQLKILDEIQNVLTEQSRQLREIIQSRK